MSPVLSPRPLRGAATAACAAALAFGAVGCGGGGGGNADADPAAAVPASAPFYFEIVMRPDGKLAKDTEAALRKILGTADVEGQIQKIFDEGSSKDKVDFAKDVEPWLGKRAGVFVSSVGGTTPDGAALVAAKDTGEAQDFIDRELKKDSDKEVKRSYKDEDYVVSDGAAIAVIEDFVVLGTDRGLKAVVDAMKGDEARTLAKADDFRKSLKAVGADGLGTVYTNPALLIDAIGSSGAVPPQALTTIRQALAGSGAKAAVAKLGVAADAFSLETATLGAKVPPGDQGDAAGAVAALPEDAWFGAGIGAIGERGRQAIAQLGQIGALAGVDPETILSQIREQSGIDIQRDLLSWMGDGGLFVRGTSIADIGGALVVQSSDPARSEAAVGKLARLVRGQSSGTVVRPLTGVQGVDRGVVFSPDPSSSGPKIQVILAAAGDRFVVAVGRPALEAALRPSGRLAESDSFKQAAGKLGNGIKPTVFFDVPPVLRFAEGLGAADSPQYMQAKKYLDAFAALVAGGRRDGDTARSKLVLGLK